MKHSLSRLTSLARVGLACAALMVVLPTPAEASNACSGCTNASNLECGIQIAFIIDSCCGNWVDGHSQCVAGYGFAVACETGRQCMCNSQGGDCEMMRMAG